MQPLQHVLAGLLKDESGQDLVEYALVVALVSLGSVSAMNALTKSISTAFSTVGSSLSSSVN